MSGVQGWVAGVARQAGEIGWAAGLPERLTQNDTGIF
jgi:hypothetical protein